MIAVPVFYTMELVKNYKVTKSLFSFFLLVPDRWICIFTNTIGYLSNTYSPLFLG